MAQTEIQGLKDVLDLTDNIGRATDQAIESGLIEAGEYMVDQIRAAGSSLGVYRTGSTIRSFKAAKPKKTNAGYYLEIKPYGKNPGGARNAEVAFLNEYGVPSKRMAPRPFMQMARDRGEDTVGKIMEKHISESIDK